MFLFDTKCIHAGSTHYSTAAQRVRCGAVERRAAKVAVDYEANARRKDEKYNRTQRGEVGPVLARLRTYPPVQGVVWGAYGESNKLVETLIGVAAQRPCRLPLKRETKHFETNSGTVKLISVCHQRSPTIITTLF